MKKATLLFTSLLVSGVGLHGQGSYSITADFAYTSEYVFRGLERADNSMQGSVEVLVGDVYVGGWTNQPVTKNADNEIDFYAGYSFDVSDQLSLDLGGTYYWYPEANGAATRDATEAFLGIRTEMGGFTPAVYGYYDITREATTLQGSIGYSFPLQAWGVSLDMSILGGWSDADDLFPDSGMEVADGYTYWGADVSIPFRLSQTSTLTVGGHYADTANVGFGAPSSENVWFTVALTTGF